jgi:dTDP-4-dehydrorhamnose reductase
MSGVGDCFRNPTQARQTNTTATQLLAELAERHRSRMIHVSTDLVFNGEKGWYRETDCPAPLSVYGHTKASAERIVLGHDGHLVLRISLLFGPSINGRTSFFDQQIDALLNNKPCTLFEDEWRTPLSLCAAARGLLAAAESDMTGILHLAGPERMSRFDMGQRLARLLHKSEATLVAASREDFAAAEPRPRDTSLACDRWHQCMPNAELVNFEDALRAFGIAS